jgi:hypothetical protein
VLAQAAAVIAAVLLSSPSAATADSINMPRPQSEQLNGFELFEMLGVSRDRLPASTVPGSVTNNERVNVTVAGDGSVQQVRDQQQIELSGEGDYHVREAGPARSAVALGGDEPPVLDLGDIVWQGFSPGYRQLGADLTLDPLIESAHLPLRIALSFAAAAGRGVAIGPSAQLPGPGTVTLTITNATRQTTVLPTADDSPAQPVAAALDSARTAARGPAAARLPTVGTTLPAKLPVTGASTRRATHVVPLRLRGELRLTGGVATSISAAHVQHPLAVRLDGILHDSITFNLAVDGEGTLELDLTAVPVLDPRPLIPPHGVSTWATWAAAGPSAAERRSALDLLVQTAAIGARAAAYSPYLGPHLGPAGSTVFHYALAPAASPVTPTRALRPRPVAIALTVLAVLLLVGGGVVIWRRS